MEIVLVPHEETLILSINNQSIAITPFITNLPGGVVKMGIEAPAEVAVNREEIYRLKQAKQLMP